MMVRLHLVCSRLPTATVAGRTTPIYFLDLLKEPGEKIIRYSPEGDLP